MIDDFVSDSLATASITPEINIILRKDKTKSELIQYFHGSLLWPLKDTFKNAIQSQFLSSFPELTPSLLFHLPPSAITAQGHMRQEFKNLQSTNYKDKLRDIQKKIDDLKSSSPTASLQDLLESDIKSDSSLHLILLINLPLL